MTGWVQQLEQVLPTFRQSLSLSPVFAFVFCVVFVDQCLSFCLFFWSLHCLSFFNLLLLITLLVSSNCSCNSNLSNKNYSKANNMLIYLQKHSLDSNYMKLQTLTTSEKGTYIVMKQPMSLDRLSVHDVSHNEATGN